MAGANDDLRSVIVWFQTAEQMLSSVLDIIPYEKAHEEVWSPRLVTVLLETCSQLDSLLKQHATQSSLVNRYNLKVSDYFEYFGQHLSEKWVVFWGESAQKIKPFEKWHGLASYRKNTYSNHEIDLWKAYNKVKHNRIENRREAKLRYTVEAMGGLLLAILYCGICREAVGASGWLQSSRFNPKARLEDHIRPNPLDFVVAETRLFAYPVGWMKAPIHSHLLWAGPASDRFRSWFEQQVD